MQTAGGRVGVLGPVNAGYRGKISDRWPSSPCSLSAASRTNAARRID